MMDTEIRIPIVSERDMVPARAQARTMALQLGFARTDATLIATAISEVVRNILAHARRGEIVMRPLNDDGRQGLMVVAADEGRGISNVDEALSGSWGSRGGRGLGLPGARRLMDEFDVDSTPRRGTTVTMRKWLATSAQPVRRDGDDA